MAMRRVFAKAAVLAAASAVAALAADAKKSQKLREASIQAEADLCQDLKSLKVALAPIDTVQATTKVQELRNARLQAEKEIKEVKASIAKLQDAKAKELDVAYDEFKKALQKIPGSETVGDAAPTISEDVKALQMARERYNAPLSCEMEGSLRKELRK